MGFGQVKLGLLHEILGRSPLGPLVFGNNAPDSGNAELLAIGIEQSGREDHREKWLQPLLDGTLRSAFSMTEPGAGADPTLISTTAFRDGDEWVINGHKWFTSNGSVADFLIVMAVTNPDVHPYQGCSMIVVPAGVPGVDVVRDVPTMEDPTPHFAKIGAHSEIIYRDVRVPVENLIGNEGEGFRLAQMRLGPGRIHHCMRWLGQSRRAFDMLCERAVSRYVHGSLLADKQTVQNWVADSMAEMTAARLMTLQAAWKMDRDGAGGGPGGDRHDQVLRRRRALQRHRPGHPGPRIPRFLHRPSPGTHVPGGPGGADLRRSRRGPQGHRGPPGPEGLHARPTSPPSTSPPAGRRPKRSSPNFWSRSRPTTETSALKRWTTARPSHFLRTAGLPVRGRSWPGSSGPSMPLLRNTVLGPGWVMPAVPPSGPKVSECDLIRPS